VSDLFKILSGVTKVLFNGILQVLSGGFGLGAAVVGWLQVGLQLCLASNHSDGFFSGAITFAGLVIVQMVAGLLSFSIMNGAAYEPNSKKRMSPLEALIVMFVWAAIVSFGLNGILVLVVGIFAPLDRVWPLLVLDSAVACLQAIAVFFVLNKAIKR